MEMVRLNARRGHLYHESRVCFLCEFLQIRIMKTNAGTQLVRGIEA